MIDRHRVELGADPKIIGFAGGKGLIPSGGAMNFGVSALFEFFDQGMCFSNQIVGSTLEGLIESDQIGVQITRIDGTGQGNRGS